METIIQEMQNDPLAKFRAEVAAEKAEPRGKMSDAALAKLRAINAQDKLDDIDAGRFKTALSQVIVNPENLRRLIERCNTSVRPPAEILDRMGYKLGWWITAGYLLGRGLDSDALINFFSTLATDEMYMSDTQFFGTWNLKDAAQRRQSRINREVIPAEEPAFRPCKSAKKCMKFEKRKPAPAAGKGDYCSTACAASDRARQKRALAGMPSAVIQ